MTESDPLLSVRDLEKVYPITEGLLRREVGRVRAVDGVSFDVHRGEVFGLVGESGCGKSTTAHTLLRLEEPTGGEVRFDSEDVGAYDDADLRRFRRRAQLVLQDPEAAFNPRMTVGEAVAEPLRVHGITDAERCRRVVADTLERVGLSGADADSYPHEFSGGEKQRIALARALVLNPDLIVADEPVSALDGRTKSDVLALMGDLQREFDVAIVLISHDVDLVRRFCDRVAVMYLGRIVERGPTDAVLGDPMHPYTQVLVSAVPDLDPAADEGRTVEPLTDDLPDASDLPSGCRFHPRCPAIIQPEGIDLPREQWHGLLALRSALATDPPDADALLAALPGTANLNGTDRSSLGPRMRARLDLPDRLPDEDAGAALTAAVEAIERGDFAAARDRLATTFESVCERDDPALSDADASRPVACHRYDGSMPGEPRPWLGAESDAD